MRVAVVGAGVVGLSVARSLVRHGCEVLCFEAERPMAARSVGDSRIFRLAHADPALVAFARRAQRLWSDWERDYRDRAAMPAGSSGPGQDPAPRLVRPCGLVLTGAAAGQWAAALAAAGAEHVVGADAAGQARVPARVPNGTVPALIDPAAGVIDVRATGGYLRDVVGSRVRVSRVDRIRVRGDRASVLAADGRHEADRVVIAAGAGTPELAATAGIDVPVTVAHHARFTFPLRHPAGPPPMCWLDMSESWRTGVTFYQHLSSGGRWSVGADLGAAEIAWERGRDAVVARSAEIVSGYVREVLHGVGTEVLETVYCTVTGLGDGIHVAGSGPVTAVWGDNLFKHAPALGEALAAAVLDGTVPDLPDPPNPPDVPA